LIDGSSLVADPVYQVFISHSSLDTWVAQQIQLHISDCGPTTFLDEGDIYVGDDFENVILVELRKCREVLVLFTPWARERPYVWLEVGAAWGLGKRIVFVLHGMTADDLSKGVGNPALLKRTNVITINDLNKYFRQLKARFDAKGGDHE
jgi:TIR domain